MTTKPYQKLRMSPRTYIFGVDEVVVHIVGKSRSIERKRSAVLALVGKHPLFKTMPLAINREDEKGKALSQRFVDYSDLGL